MMSPPSWCPVLSHQHYNKQKCHTLLAIFPASPVILHCFSVSLYGLNSMSASTLRALAPDLTVNWSPLLDHSMTTGQVGTKKFTGWWVCLLQQAVTLYHTLLIHNGTKMVEWQDPVTYNIISLLKSHWMYIIPYPTAFPYGNGMVLHFYQQQESSMTKTVHKVINKGLKAYV